MASREQMIKEVINEQDLVQYDGKDEARIAHVASLFTHAAMTHIEALGAYTDQLKAPVDDSSADLMKEARGNVVMSWGAVAAIVSKIAAVMRIDGDTAFQRVLDTAHTNQEPDVAGL